ncbi:MAG: hypothetical protein RL131_532, partial [Bacteroidota bacterium]
GQDSIYTREYLLPYSINLAGAGQFEESLHAVNRFLLIPKLNEQSILAARYRKKNMEFAIADRKQDTSAFDFKVTHAGVGINSEASEYFPSLTIDENQLVFTRRVRNATDEDFFASNKQNGIWSAAQPLQGSINTPLKEGAQQISQDGKWLVYAGEYPDGYGRFDIYISILGSNGWSEKINLGPAVNSEFWESAPCLSPDKNEVYFSSDRPGGYGGIDLYVSRLMANGRWSAAQNLGPQINTAGDETGPFLHADNETLYFTSSGLPGYGGSDIFMTKKLVNGFSIPQNLGFPINTIDNEGTLVVTSDGQTAYFASDRVDSRGGLDIYSFAMRPVYRPLTTSWVEGRVYDSITNKGLNAVVELVDVQTQRVVTSVSTDRDGNYLCTLPLGKNYAFSVNKKGYLFYSGRFSLTATTEQSGLKKDIPLQPFKKGANIVLNNILFETGSFKLLSESMGELDKVVSILQDNPGIKVELSGHTDATGNPEDNQKLSEARAKSVVDFLISKGISANRLSYKGYGSTKPIASNETDEGKALNRRTELTVISEN